MAMRVEELPEQRPSSPLHIVREGIILDFPIKPAVRIVPGLDLPEIKIVVDGQVRREDREEGGSINFARPHYTESFTFRSPKPKKIKHWSNEEESVTPQDRLTDLEYTFNTAKNRYLRENGPVMRFGDFPQEIRDKWSQLKHFQHRVSEKKDITKPPRVQNHRPQPRTEMQLAAGQERREIQFKLETLKVQFGITDGKKKTPEYKEAATPYMERLSQLETILI